MNYYYFTMEHRGGIKEALETIKMIDKDTAKKLIAAKIYKYYCYDSRIRCRRYLIEKMEKNMGLPAWILEQETEQTWVKFDGFEEAITQ